MIEWVEPREPLASWVSVLNRDLPGPGTLTAYPGLSWITVDDARSAVINGDTGGWIVATNDARNSIEQLWGTRVDPGNHPVAAALWRRGLGRLDGCGAFDGVDVGAAIEETRQRYTLVLLLSTGCNLACNYCYLGHRLPTRDVAMPAEVALAAIDGALETEWDEVMFDFGEVAVSWKSFGPLADEAIKRSRQVGKRARIAIQTNGTTIDATAADQLAELNAVVGLSLDGPRDIHDSARAFRSGAGSYDRAVNALHLLAERDVAVHIISTIGRHNVDRPIDVVEEVLTHRPTSFLLKPVLAEGEAGAAWDKEGVSAQRYAQFTRTVIRHAVARGADRLDQSATKFLNRLLGDRNGWRDSCTSRYCGSGRTLHVVDPKGGTHACPRFVDDTPPPGVVLLPLMTSPPVSQPPRRAADVARPNLADLLPESLRRPPADCSGCEWLSSCGGGCTLISRDDRAAAVPQPDPHCDAYDVAHRELFTTLIPAYIGGRHREATAFNGARVVTLNG
ncbi:Radical SAM domain protein [Mycolicibacterium rhodesiae JS60]|nr:Radical SAM domain protein [Mycolicibacterium rhodesiae JS60]